MRGANYLRNILSNFPEQNDLISSVKVNPEYPGSGWEWTTPKSCHCEILKHQDKGKLEGKGVRGRWSPKKVNNPNSFAFFNSTLEI